MRVTTLQQEEITVDLFVNMPQSHSRVKDCLNLPQTFFPLFVGEEVLYLNTDSSFAYRTDGEVIRRWR